MTPTRLAHPVSSLNCGGCDCGACLSETVAAIEQLDGAIHVRVDRTRTRFVVRCDAMSVDALELQELVQSAKLDPL